MIREKTETKLELAELSKEEIQIRWKRVTGNSKTTKGSRRQER